MNPWLPKTPFKVPAPKAYLNIGTTQDVLENELRDRYGSAPLDTEAKQADQIARMAVDMGIGPYGFTFRPSQDEYLKKMNAVGSYVIPKNEILAARNTNGQDRATLFHETAHLADKITTPWFSSTNSPNEQRGHFEPFPPSEDPEFDLARTLQAQREIEEGYQISPQGMSEMPWLKTVVPHSSNFLANPWRQKLKRSEVSYTPETWNKKWGFK